jgi:DNA helicase HerA-like ATPase
MENWPGRNPTQMLDSEGILLGYIKHGENAGIPIFWNPDDPKYMCKHLAIFGGSGSGKSTFQL